MTARLHEATLDHALQIARDVDLEGPGPLLSPAVVAWLAQLALGHPQVSAAVAAALPSSGVRWLTPYLADDARHSIQTGKQVARIRYMTGLEGAGWRWTVPGETGIAPTYDAARAEVDERLLAAGYTLLGEVYRRAPVDAPETETCSACDGLGEVRVDDDAEGEGDEMETCFDCDGGGRVPLG